MMSLWTGHETVVLDETNTLTLDPTTAWFASLATAVLIGLFAIGNTDSQAIRVLTLVGAVVLLVSFTFLRDGSPQ